MTELSISSNSKLTDLDSFLNTTNIDGNLNLSNNSKYLTVSLSSEFNIDTFYTQLSIFIFSTLETKLITKTKEFFEKKEMKSLSLESIIEEDLFTVYINPIKILIKEHFKYSTHMNIDSFINFNCKGLKKELNARYNDYMVLFNQEANNQYYFNETTSNNNPKEVDSSISSYKDIKNLNSIFEKLKHTISFKLDKNLSEDLSLIHLRSRFNNIELISNDKKDLYKIIHSMLESDVFEELDQSNEHLKLFVYILFCIIILDCKQIIFHKSIPDDFTSQILLYLYETSYLNEKINQVNFLKCKGCNIC